ncbi:MAG: FtsX-like permease family protein [Pseudomonadota bacterium]
MTGVRTVASGRDIGALFRLALRDLRGGLRGFTVFVVCVALGVGIITAVNIVSDSLTAGFSSEGRRLLGGDIALSRVHQPAREDERKDLAALGQVSEIATLRSMAEVVEPARGDETALSRVMVEVKAVDDAYPLAGTLVGSQNADLAASVQADRVAVVAPILLERLGVAVGDRLRLGEVEVTIADTIAKEPDGLTARAAFGPRLLVSLDTLKASDLVGPGSLVRWRYRVALSEENPGARSDAGLAQSVEAVKATFTPAGFGVRDRRDPAPGITAGIDRFRQFLTLVGLTAMFVGGIGVANAVAAFLDGRATTIAILQSLGARRRLVFGMYLAEILMIAALGVAVGLVIGIGVPWLVWQALASGVTVPVSFTVAPASLLLAAAYGFLVSLIFVLWPLGRIDGMRPASLFRDRVAGTFRWPRRGLLLATCAAMAALIALTVLANEERAMVLGFFAGIAGLFGLFVALAWTVRWAARRSPRFGSTALVLALRSLGGPGALTQPIVVSLGTGLTLLVAVTLTDTSLTRELSTRLPANAPSFFFLDVRKDVASSFETDVAAVAPGGVLREAPMLRGRVIKVRGERADKIDAAPDAVWVLNGDRGLSFSKDVPAGSSVVEGDWWAEDYSGPPLVSFEADLARGLGLKLGDTITVNVLGRPITATIANLRKVDWGTLSINFVLIYSPNTLAAAPFNYLYTLTFPGTPTLRDEAQVLSAVGTSHPDVTALRVRDAIDAAAGLLDRILTAIRGIGGLTLLIGAVVLAGAITTTQRRRVQQAVLLKTIGATPRRVLWTGMLEFALLAVAVSLVAVALGTLAAWAITTRVIDVHFAFSAWAVLEAIAIAVLLTLAFGAVSLWRVLRAPPVPYLRGV